MSLVESTVRNGLSRREFAAAAAGLTHAKAETGGPKILIVVAHPDDEYAFAATVYRLAKELGATVDQAVISNGEGGYRYSALAEQIYGEPLTHEETGRKRLPEIRKKEALAAGRILGIRRHFFLDQKDARFTLDSDEASHIWDLAAVREFLSSLLAREHYQYVFTLLPYAETHGHHQAATLLALEAAQTLPESQRPTVLGADPGLAAEPARAYRENGRNPLTRASGPVYEFSRVRRFGFRDALNYSIVVNWVIAEHKSQGLFQQDVGRHDVERFWLFDASGPHARQAAEELFERLASQPVAAAGRRIQ